MRTVNDPEITSHPLIAKLMGKGFYFKFDTVGEIAVLAYHSDFALDDGTPRSITFASVRVMPDRTLDIDFIQTDPEYQKMGLATAVVIVAMYVTNCDRVKFINVKTGGDGEYLRNSIIQKQVCCVA